VNRLEELTLRSADGELTPGEGEEIERLIAGSPEAARGHAALLDLEAALRAGRNHDATAAIMAQLGARDAQTVDAVMQAIAGRVPRHKPSRRLWRAASAAAVAGGLAFAISSAMRDRPGTGTRSADPGASQETDGKGSMPRFMGGQPPAGPATPGTSPGNVQTIFSYDFEDDTPPPELFEGALVSGPFRENNRGCAQGQISEHAPTSNMVTLRRWDSGAQSPGPFGLATFNEKRVLVFDYYLAPGSRQMNVQLFGRGDMRQNHARMLEEVVTGVWTRATVRLVDLIPVLNKDKPLKDGDALLTVVIVGGRMGISPLYVDNVRLLEYTDGDLPPTSAR
jgi:hypothetical protein